jgi:class 3 adenylate cyclase
MKERSVIASEERTKQSPSTEIASSRFKVGLAMTQVRIGVHTGSVIAGVVGDKKFAYDIWGDTVNTASRMESSGEAGKVNISGSTYNLIKDKLQATNYQLQTIFRGIIHPKNKGEIEMYFVEIKN